MKKSTTSANPVFPPITIGLDLSESEFQFFELNAAERAIRCRRRVDEHTMGGFGGTVGASIRLDGDTDTGLQ